MSNYYAPCFYRIDFVVIPSYIELPCENQQLLMMLLLQQHKLINAFFLKIILLSSCQKYPMFYRVFMISSPNILFICKILTFDFDITFNFRAIKVFWKELTIYGRFNLVRCDLNSVHELNLNFHRIIR